MGFQIDRRTALLAGPALWAGAAVSADAAADPLWGAALYADVQAYAALGPHRTGTAGDDATTEWMLRALRAAGYQAERQGFDYPVFELARADVTLGERRIDAFPVWTPAATGAEVTAPLSTTARPGAILLMSLPYGTGAGLGAATYRAPIEAALAAGAAGVVAVTRNPVGELAALNAEPRSPPWPAPVLLAAGRDEAALQAAAATGAVATLRLEGRTTTRTADNVVARRPGPGRTLIVSTPKSGWMTCAGERGSGVAIWLGLARWLATQPQYDVLLAAASGHEFDGYGGHLFAEHHAPPPAATRLWTHIGANVAAYDYGLVDGVLTRLDHPQATRLLACSESLLPLARAAFAGQPAYGEPIDIDVRPAPGEVAYYQKLGYRPLVGVVGTHPLHHTPRDLPDVTGPEMLEPVARGLQRMLAAAPA